MTPLLIALLQDPEPPPAPPPPPAAAQPPAPPPPPVVQEPAAEAQAEPAPPPEAMSEGRMLVAAYNSGFQFGLSPGLVFVRGKPAFALGVRFGYGIDTGPVIVVPGVRLAGYFADPNVYLGMPTVKLVVPIDRFAPFVEAGGGVGQVSDPSKVGFAWLAGGGFMIHFRHFAFGAEVSYQAITGTGFRGIGLGPILAFGF